MEKIKELIETSNTLGRDILLIQGPGGNFSFKRDDSLWIKSSGVLLKNITTEYGIAEISLSKFNKYFPPDTNTIYPTELDEKNYIRAINESSITQKPERASIEAGVHTSIQHDWVIHVHSIAGILLGLLPFDDLKNKLLEPITDAGFSIIPISPSIPGLQLSWRIGTWARATEKNAGTLWILENHGLIWSSNDLSLLKNVAGTFEENARAAFDLSKYPEPELTGSGQLDFSAWENFYFSAGPIFPDYVVFFPHTAKYPTTDNSVVSIPSDLNTLSSDIIREMIYAHALIGTISSNLNCIKPLTTRMTAAISGLEIEKIRMEQIRKDNTCEL